MKVRPADEDPLGADELRALVRDAMVVDGDDSTVVEVKLIDGDGARQGHMVERDVEVQPLRQLRELGEGGDLDLVGVEDGAPADQDLAQVGVVGVVDVAGGAGEEGEGQERGGSWLHN